MAFKVLLSTKAGLFPGFAQVFFVLIVQVKLSEWAVTKTQLCVLSITQLQTWGHQRSAYAQLSPFYLLSTLYVTHVII